MALNLTTVSTHQRTQDALAFWGTPPVRLANVLRVVYASDLDPLGSLFFRSTGSGGIMAVREFDRSVGLYEFGEWKDNSNRHGEGSS